MLRSYQGLHKPPDLSQGLLDSGLNDPLADILWETAHLLQECVQTIRPLPQVTKMHPAPTRGVMPPRERKNLSQSLQHFLCEF